MRDGSVAGFAASLGELHGSLVEELVQNSEIGKWRRKKRIVNISGMRKARLNDWVSG